MTMTERTSQQAGAGKRLRPLGLLVIYLALVVVPVSIYYFVYYSNAHSYHLARGFRVLDEVPTQIVERLERVKKSLRFYESSIVGTEHPKRYFFQWPEEVDVWVKVHRLAAGADEAEGTPATGSALPTATEAACPTTKATPSAPPGASATPTPTSTPTATTTASPSLTPAGAPTVTPVPKARFKFVGSKKVVVSRTSTAKRIEATMRFAGLVPSERALAYFDQVLIVHKGEVIYQDGSPFPKITSVEGLVADDSGNGEAAEKAEASDKATALRLEIAEKHATLDTSPPAKSPRPRRSVAERVPIGGTQYRVFVVPFELPQFRLRGSELSDEDAFHAYGIVRESKFQGGAGRPSLPTLGIVLVLLILGVLAWPYLKIVLIGSKEKLRPVDAHYLMASLVMGSGLAAMLIMLGVARQNLVAEADHETENIARAVRQAFAAELTEAIKTAYGRADALWNNEPPECDDASPGVYPDYELAFAAHDDKQCGWMDTRRALKLKAGFELPRKRAYYRRALKGPLWPCPPQTLESQSGCQFFIERIPAAQEGVVVSMVSIPWKSGAIVLGKRFLSLWSPALPPSFGFALVDSSSGKVLYHSDDRISLVENIFIETDDDTRMKVAVSSQQRDAFDGSYHGHGHHFLVEPMPFVPWSLVVFRDKQLLDALEFETLITACLSFVVYGLLFGIAVVLVSSSTSESRWSWIWPQPGREQRCEIALAVVVAIGGVYASAIWAADGEGHGGPILGLVLLVPVALVSALYCCLGAAIATRRWRKRSAAIILLASVVAIWVVCSRNHLWSPDVLRYLRVLLLFLGGAMALRWWRRPRPSLWYWRRLYFAVAFVSVVVLAGLPAWAIFQDARLLVGEMRAGYRQESVAQAVRLRDEALQTDAVRLDKKYGGPKRVRVQALPFREAIYTATGTNDWLVSASDDGSSRPEVGPPSSERSREPTSSQDGDARWSPISDQLRKLWWRHPTAFFLSPLPAYTSLVGELRSFMYPRHDRPLVVDGPDATWPWYIEDLRSAGDVRARRPCLQGGEIAVGPSSDDKPRYSIERRPSLSHLPVGWWPRVIWTIVVLLAMFAIYRTLLTLAQRVLAIDLPDFVVGPPLRDPVELVKESRLFIRPPKEYVEHVQAAVEAPKDRHVEVLTFPSVRPYHGPRSWLTDACYYTDGTDGAVRTIVLVRHFEAVLLASPQDRRATLECLEDLLRRRLTVFIVSSVSPLYGLTVDAPYPDMSPAEASEIDDRYRWTKLLGTFRKGRFAPPSDDRWTSIKDRAAAALARECRGIQELDEVEARVRSTRAFVEHRLSDEQIVEYVADQAEPHYRKMWSLCTKDERLMLIDLAKGNLVNPRNTEVLERLLRRGLVRRAPHFELLNRSFGRFVEQAELPERLAEWQREASSSMWLTVRGPILAVLVLLGGFLLFTAREALDEATMGIVTGTLAALPFLLRLLGSSKIGQSPSG